MPLVPLAVNNIVEFRVHGLCQNQEVINRFHFRAVAGTVGGPNVRTDDVLAEAIDSWRTNVIPVMLTTYGVYQYFVGRIVSVAYDVVKEQYKIAYDQQTVEGGVAGSDTGTLAAGDQLPVFVAMNLQRRCTVVNKNTRGATRISPHNESHQANGSWETTRATAVKNALNTAFVPGITPVVGGLLEFNHVVFSPSQGSKLGPGPVWPVGVAEDIATYLVNPLVSSQTTRKIRQAGY